MSKTKSFKFLIFVGKDPIFYGLSIRNIIKGDSARINRNPTHPPSRSHRHTEGAELYFLCVQSISPHSSDDSSSYHLINSRVALFPKILFKIVILHNIKRLFPKNPKNYEFSKKLPI